MFVSRSLRLGLGVAVFALCLAGCGSAGQVKATVTTQPAPTITTTLAASPSPIPTSPTNDWIPLRSTAPADIIAAARQSALFHLNPGGDSFNVTPQTPVGTPVLVRALRDSEFPDAPDFYALPLEGSGGGIAQLELNPTRTAIQVVGIAGGSVSANGGIGQYTQTQAVDELRAQRGIGTLPGTQPIQVYFPINATDLESGTITWTGGGLSPTTPAWLLHGANGVYYVAADDGHIYSLAELPLHPSPPSGY